MNCVNCKDTKIVVTAYMPDGSKPTGPCPMCSAMTDTPKQTDRDPRVDPVRGDVFQRGNVWRRIESVRDNKTRSDAIVYTQEYRNNRFLASRSISTWRKWAAAAEIVKRGDE